MTISITINEAAWQWALDQANAERLSAHERQQAAARQQHEFAESQKPVEERTPFEPEEFKPTMLIEYVRARVADLGADYERQELDEMVALLKAEDAVSKRRVAKILKASTEVREQFAAQVDALGG